MNRSGKNHPSETSGTTVQIEIERVLRRYREEGRWDLAVLYTSDGMQMARDGCFGEIGEAPLLEIAFMLKTSVHTLGASSGPWELTLRPGTGSRFVFFFFETRDDMFILAVVTQGKKRIRRALLKLKKTLLNLM